MARSFESVAVEVYETLVNIDPADENNVLIVLDAFGLPVYKLEDELYQNYVLTCDHRRIKPMTVEQLVSFLRRLETIGALTSFKKRREDLLETINQLQGL